jgi:hypothetical protein
MNTILICSHFHDGLMRSFFVFAPFALFLHVGLSQIRHSPNPQDRNAAHSIASAASILRAYLPKQGNSTADELLKQSKIIAYAARRLEKNADCLHDGNCESSNDIHAALDSATRIYKVMQEIQSNPLPLNSQDNIWIGTVDVKNGFRTVATSTNFRQFLKVCTTPLRNLW